MTAEDIYRQALAGFRQLLVDPAQSEESLALARSEITRIEAHLLNLANPVCAARRDKLASLRSAHRSAGDYRDGERCDRLEEEIAALEAEIDAPGGMEPATERPTALFQKGDPELVIRESVARLAALPDVVVPTDDPPIPETWNEGPLPPTTRRHSGGGAGAEIIRHRCTHSWHRGESLLPSCPGCGYDAT